MSTDSDEVSGRGPAYLAEVLKEIEGRDPNQHLDGTPWHEAAAPGRFHRCWVQTEGIVGGPLGDLYQRCPCGAIRHNEGRWMERNARRKDR